MAFLDSAVILAEIRSILEDGAGLLRTIDAGTYEGGGQAPSDTERSLRALVKPRLIVRMGPVALARDAPPHGGDVIIYDLPFQVTVIRHIPPAASDDDAVLDAVIAAGCDDGDRIYQALGEYTNLTAGGLICGSVRLVSARQGDLRMPSGGGDYAAGRLETTYMFASKVEVRPATS